MCNIKLFFIHKCQYQAHQNHSLQRKNISNTFYHYITDIQSFLNVKFSIPEHHRWAWLHDCAGAGPGMCGGINDSGVTGIRVADSGWGNQLHG